MSYGVAKHLSSVVDSVNVKDNPIQLVRYTFALIMGVYGLYYAFRTPYSSTLYGAVHLGFAISLYALVNVEERDTRFTQLVDAFVFIMVVASTIYVIRHFEALTTSRNVIGYTQLDLIVGIIILLTLAEYTRREYGYVLFGVIVFAALYGWFGQSLPGVFEHTGISSQRLLEIMVLNFTGAWGSLTVIAALWVYIFLLWAGLLRSFNEIDSLLDLTYLIGRRFKSGIYQVAVVASMFVGAIVGTPAGNVVISGNFTIPMMIDRGMVKERAAAIESVASTGGMVLPPIMGSAAFVMASLLGMSYAEIIIHATLTAAMLYVLIAIAVHFSVLRDRRIRLRSDQSNSNSINFAEREIDKTEIKKSAIPVLIGGIVLVIALAYYRTSPTLGGLYTIGAYLTTKVLIALVVKEFNPASFVKNLSDGLVVGSVMMAPITIILASMNAVVGVFSSTGLPVTVAVQGESLTGGIFIVVLLVVAAVTIVFGMGMPISAAYLLTISLMEPLLTEFGITALIAHFFVLYWAMVAAITPPVALSCAIASNIAEGDFLKTVKESVMLGTPYFVLPFLFITRPELIIYDGLSTVTSAVIVLVSISIAMAGIQRVFEAKLANILAIVLGFMLLFSDVIISLV